MDTNAKPDLPPAPSNPAGHSPRRRPGSVRRTSTIDMTWPEGRGGPLLLKGVARDVLSRIGGGAPVILAQDFLRVHMASDRTIVDIQSDPPRPHLQALVGARGGGRLRQALQDHLPEEKAAGTPLYLLLDDLSGASLISGWAWSRWSEAWMTPPALSGGQRPPAPRVMEGVCAGFRPGSSALRPDGGSMPDQNSSDVPPLPHPRDPRGWHEIESLTGVSMRRARRIDLWLDDAIRIDATFQDSAGAPAGGRVAVHEYSLTVTADPATLTLTGAIATPRVLPYRECPAAAANVDRLIGAPLRELRSLVLAQLSGTLGCTHLNDALRALAEAPLLLRRLEAHLAAPAA